MRNHSLRYIYFAVLIIAILAGTLFERFLYRAIRAQAYIDEARPAGAVVVMGAAEYDGAPSPVYQARLDRALDLEERGLASMVITTGGSGGDRHYTEAGVGRDYLVQAGVAADQIIADTEGGATYQSVRSAAQILHRLHASTCIVVSDGFHLFRVKIFFAAFRITAYGSPVPNSSIEADPFLRTLYSLRELLSLNLWYLHIHV